MKLLVLLMIFISCGKTPLDDVFYRDSDKDDRIFKETNPLFNKYTTLFIKNGIYIDGIPINFYEMEDNLAGICWKSSNGKREKHPQLKECNFRVKFSEVDDNLICLLEGDNFLIKSNKQNAIEDFSQKIMEEL